MLAGIGLDLAVHGLDAPFDVGEVIEQLFEQHPHGGGQIILRIGQMPPDVGMESTTTDPHRQPIFEAEGAPDHLKGSAFGTFNLVTGIVVLAGNTLAGWLWHSAGSTTPFLAGAALATVATIGIASGASRSKQG